MTLTYESIARLAEKFPRPKMLWIGFTAFVPERQIYKLLDNDREAVLVAHPDFEADLAEAGIWWRPFRERSWRLEEPWP